jgi:hypothetical protein
MSAYRIGFEAAEAPQTRTRGRPSTDAGSIGGAELGRHAEQATNNSASSNAPFQAIFNTLTKWIPSDTLAIYLPGVTLFSESDKPSMIFVLIMLLATPSFVLASAYATGRPLTRAVAVSALLSAISFALWSFSVPANGWQSFKVVSVNRGAVAVVAAIAAILFSYVAEGTVKRTKGLT